MPYAQRLLENGSPRLLENGVIRALELVPTLATGLGRLSEDMVLPGPTARALPIPTSRGRSVADLALGDHGTADAGTLVITADGTAMSMAIGIAVVLWDERGNPISVNSGMLTLSGWCKNAAGNYITANGYGIRPWVPRGRCLPRGRVHRARPVDHSQRQREPAHQALLIVGRGRIVGRGAWSVGRSSL